MNPAIHHLPGMKLVDMRQERLVHPDDMQERVMQTQYYTTGNDISGHMMYKLRTCYGLYCNLSSKSECQANSDSRRAVNAEQVGSLISYPSKTDVHVNKRARLSSTAQQTRLSLRRHHHHHPRHVTYAAQSCWVVKCG